eukprot:g64451.t1
MSSHIISLIESTKARAARLLEEYGDPETAMDEAHKNSYSWSSSFQQLVLGSMPYVGAASSLIFPMWLEIREVALVAALRGYDVEEEDIKVRILLCAMAAGGEVMGKVAIQKAAKIAAEKVAQRVGSELAQSAVSKFIPVGAVYAMVVEDSERAFEKAKAIFPPNLQRQIDEDSALTPFELRRALRGSLSGNWAESEQQAPPLTWKTSQLVPPIYGPPLKVLAMWTLGFWLFLRWAMPALSSRRVFLPGCLLAWILIRGFQIDRWVLVHLEHLSSFLIQRQLLPQTLTEINKLDLSQAIKGPILLQIPAVGAVACDIDNLHMKRVSVGPVAARVSVRYIQYRLRIIVVQELRVEIGAKLKVTKQNYPRLSTGGDMKIEVTVRGMGLSLKPGLQHAKDLTIETLPWLRVLPHLPVPNVTVQSARVEIRKTEMSLQNSKLSWLYNSLERLLQEEIRSSLEKEVEGAMTKELEISVNYGLAVLAGLGQYLFVLLLGLALFTWLTE